MTDAPTKNRPGRSVGAAVFEWLTRREALAAAKRDSRRLDARQRSLFDRARGAQRVAERIAPSQGATVPLEDVGDDVSRTLLAISILRDAVVWSLAADSKDAPADLASAFEAADGGDMAKAAGGPERLAHARRVLCEQESIARATRSSADLKADLDVTRTLADALVDGLDRRANLIARAESQRWTRILGTMFAALIVVVGAQAYVVARRPDLIPRARWSASSGDLGWGVSGVGLNGARGGADIFFCTRNQPNPWVEFDLGRTVPISRIVITNRPDCCQDRAVPLVIETSDDRRSWHEVARRDDTFVTWDKTFLFRPRGRFVRLRVTRESIFHLTRVEIH